jgi:hypothetical protein
MYPIFSFNSYKIPFVSLQAWGKTKAIFMKVQFWDTPKLSDKYKGTITKGQGENLHEHIKQMRSEWNNI